MKVVVTTADSGSVKILKFNRSVDTSLKESAEPLIDTHKLQHGPARRIVHLGDDRVAISHKNGDIAIYSVGSSFKLINVVAREVKNIIGMTLGPKDGELVVVDAVGDGCVYDTSAEDAEPISTFQLEEGLNTIAQHPSERNLYVAAGTKQLPVLFKLDSKDGETTRVWKAKNPRNTKVDLPEPNLVTCAVFLKSPANNKSGYTLATGTNHGKLRVYDTNIGGRPTHQVESSRYSIKAISASDDGIAVGDSHKTLSLWNIPANRDQKLRLLGHYAGIGGSTRSLHRRNEFIAAGGLDRYVRVYDLATREAAGKVFIGEEINDLVLISDDNEDLQQEDDDVWDQLPSKRRKTAGDDAGSKNKSSRLQESDSESEDDADSEDESEDSREGSDDSDEGSSDGFEGFDD